VDKKNTEFNLKYNWKIGKFDKNRKFNREDFVESTPKIIPRFLE